MILINLTSMLISKEKFEDKKLRQNVLYCMKRALELYVETEDEAFLSLAREFGETSKKLFERADQYAERDAVRNWIDATLRRLNYDKII